jgi:hypothetical protein
MEKPTRLIKCDGQRIISGPKLAAHPVAFPTLTVNLHAIAGQSDDLFSKVLQV